MISSSYRVSLNKVISVPNTGIDMTKTPTETYVAAINAQLKTAFPNFDEDLDTLEQLINSINQNDPFKANPLPSQFWAHGSATMPESSPHDVDMVGYRNNSIDSDIESISKILSYWGKDIKISSDGVIAFKYLGKTIQISSYKDFLKIECGDIDLSIRSNSSYFPCTSNWDASLVPVSQNGFKAAITFKPGYSQNKISVHEWIGSLDTYECEVGNFKSILTYLRLRIKLPEGLIISLDSKEIGRTSLESHLTEIKFSDLQNPKAREDRETELITDCAEKILADAKKSKTPQTDDFFSPNRAQLIKNIEQFINGESLHTCSPHAPVFTPTPPPADDGYHSGPTSADTPGPQPMSPERNKGCKKTEPLPKESKTPSNTTPRPPSNTTQPNKHTQIHSTNGAFKTPKKKHTGKKAKQQSKPLKGSLPATSWKARREAAREALRQVEGSVYD